MTRLKVKEIAEAKHISQRRLSLRSGVDLRTVQKIWRDPYKIVTTETLDKLAKVLGVDATKILPDNAKKNELYPAEEEHQDEGRSLANNSAGEDTQKGGNHNAHQADSRQHETKACRQFQGQVTEAGNRVE